MKQKARKIGSHHIKETVHNPHSAGKHINHGINWLRLIIIGSASFFCTVFIFFLIQGILQIKLPVLFLSQKKPVDISKRFITGTDPRIDPIMIKSLFENKDSNWLLIDYRSPAEYKASHIRGAINVPLYLDFNHFLVSTIPMNEWYMKYRKLEKSGKNVLLYGYWDKSKLTADLIAFLHNKRERYYVLDMGYYEFKNNYYQWAPGGDMNGQGIGMFLEGSLIDGPSRPYDGVPALPGP